MRKIKIILCTVIVFLSFVLLSKETDSPVITKLLTGYDDLAVKADKHLEKNAVFVKKTGTLKDFSYTVFKKTESNLTRFKESALFLKKQLKSAKKEDLSPKRIKSEENNIKELTIMLEKWAKIRSLAKENDSMTRHVRAALKAKETLRKELNSFIKKRK